MKEMTSQTDAAILGSIGTNDKDTM